MNDEDIAEIVEFLRQPDVRYLRLTQVVNAKPVNGWRRTCPGAQYLLIAIGPEDPGTENAIRAILGHDVDGFAK